MISFSEAFELFTKRAKPVEQVETIPTLYALGRVLAEDVVSAINVPAWDNSQMDGYCVAAADLSEASASNTVRLRVSQRIPAGSSGTRLEPGTCARIFTGAPLPEGADTVVPQENVLVDEQGLVLYNRAPRKGEWVRKKAGDIAEGSVAARAGERITAATLGLIASVGAGYVKVYRHLKVAVLFSGSELTPPGEPLPPGGIYNSNRYTLRGLLKNLDCEVFDVGTVRDTFVETVEAFRTAAKGADLIISAGGMSVGEEDHIKPAVESLGEIEAWKVSVKPGKPVALGTVCGVPFIGLPGNPVSCFVTFLLLAKPFISRSQGISDVRERPLYVRADFDWVRPGSREEFVRVRKNDRGGLDLFSNQNSQILTSCAWADGVVDIPAGTTIKAGDTVPYYAFGEVFN
ncbi:MAG: molybdopterin molybdotransferase MoeA [Duodenibacillus sp.]|nr:molybdopterin molybdotransferase MoeA [Duodenibacillus sp.]